MGKYSQVVCPRVQEKYPEVPATWGFYPEGSGGRTHWPRGSGRTRPNFYPAASEPWPQSEGVARIIGFSWRVQEHWQEGRCHLIFLDHFGPCRVPSQVHGRSPITDDLFVYISHVYLSRLLLSIPEQLSTMSMVL